MALACCRAVLWTVLWLWVFFSLQPTRMAPSVRLGRPALTIALQIVGIVLLAAHGVSLSPLSCGIFNTCFNGAPVELLRCRRAFSHAAASDCRLASPSRTHLALPHTASPGGTTRPGGNCSPLERLIYALCLGPDLSTCPRLSSSLSCLGSSFLLGRLCQQYQQPRLHLSSSQPLSPSCSGWRCLHSSFSRRLTRWLTACGFAYNKQPPWHLP